MPTNVIVPGLGESVSSAVLIKWHKSDGEFVKDTEPLCELETDKANVDVPSTGAGVLKRTVPEGTTVKIGETIATIDPNGKATSGVTTSVGVSSSASSSAASSASSKNEPSKSTATSAKTQAAGGRSTGASFNPEDFSPAVRGIIAEHNLDPSKIKATGPGGRLTKEDVIAHLDGKSIPMAGDTKSAAPVVPTPTTSRDTDMSAAATATVGQTLGGEGPIRRVAMSKIRKRIAENLVRAQHTAAILTTFNEVDLTNISELRGKFKEKFEKTHGIGLGFMSFFAKAVCQALKEYERVNASIDGDDIVYHDYVHLGIAVSTERGLTVPILKNAHQMSFAKIESEIKRVATAVRDGKLGLNELSGGTFTITNGGVFGSLLATPIINAPQSAILGMHAIKERPVVVNGQIVARPMMYVALSYDHRMIDGRESVGFLVRVKEMLEDPARLLLEV